MFDFVLAFSECFVSFSLNNLLSASSANFMQVSVTIAKYLVQKVAFGKVCFDIKILKFFVRFNFIFKSEYFFQVMIFHPTEDSFSLS